MVLPIPISVFFSLCFSLGTKSQEVLNMKNLENTLSKMAALNIKNQEMLCAHSELHEEFFLNLDSFITGTCFRSKKNINQLNELTRKYGVETDDIRFDCLERCVSKLNLVLSNDLEHQIPYLYTICNNMIITCYRKIVRYWLNTVSLNETIENHSDKNDSKKAKSLEDFIIDPKSDPESKFIAKTLVLEILHKYSNNADSLLCSIGTKVVGAKPAELAQVIMDAGSVEKALTYYIQSIQEMFGIADDELPTLPHVKSTGLSKLISKETTSSKVISSKISNILNRTK